MTIRQQVALITKLSKLYQVRVYYYKNTHSNPGIAFHRYRKVNNKFQESIHICTHKQEDLLSSFFHELGHSYCTHTHKFQYYHRLTGGRWIKGRYHYSIDGLRNMIRTAYKAECYVDRWAQKEMALWCPTLKYDAGYINNKSAHLWLDCFYLSKFRDILRHKNKHKNPWQSQ